MMNPTIAKARQKEWQRERRERIAVEILGRLINSREAWILSDGARVWSVTQFSQLAIGFADTIIKELDKDA